MIKDLDHKSKDVVKYCACDADPACAFGPVDPGGDEGRHGGHEALEAGAQRDPARDGDVVAVQRRVHHVQVDDVQLA